MVLSTKCKHVMPFMQRFFEGLDSAASDPRRQMITRPEMIPKLDRKWSQRKMRNGVKFGFLDFYLDLALILWLNKTSHTRQHHTEITQSHTFAVQQDFAWNWFLHLSIKDAVTWHFSPISVYISKNIPREFDLSLIILVQFSPRAQ